MDVSLHGASDLSQSSHAALDEPIFAVAVVLAGNDLGALHALLARLAPESFSVVLWRPDNEPLEHDAVQAELTPSRFFVQTLVDGEALEAGVLYVAPPQVRLWWSGRRLHVAAPVPGDAAPIDHYLRSFADSWGQRAIAVMPRMLQPEAIGARYDGASGLAAVQAVRGIALGPAWFDADASRLPARRGAKRPSDPRAVQRAFEQRSRELAAVTASSSAGARARRLQRLFPLSSAAAATLRSAARAAVQRTAERGRLRVWVPGCKTGTLVYTIAVLLLEAIAESGAKISLQLFGTEADEHALEVARAGRYPTSAALDLDPELRARYFFDEGETIRVAEALREVCIFSTHKMTRDAPLSRMDLLVCQRVLDNLAPAKRERVLGALSFALRDGGVLIALDHLDAFTPDRFEPLELGQFRARLGRAKTLPPPDALEADGWPPATQGEREPLVHMLGVPVLICDQELCLRELSKEAMAVLNLFERDRGRTLPELADRIPGGADLVHAARRALSGGATHELSIRSAHQAFLVRVSAFSRQDGSGVTVVLTDVTAFEAAKARAIAHQHQQAAVARVSALALSSLPQSEVFEEGLSVLFGNIPMCSAGAIAERLASSLDQGAVVARGLGAEPLAALRQLGAAGELIDRAIEEGNLVVHEGSGDASRRVSGMACPIVHEGDVLGVIALYARQPGIDAPDHRHFVQAIANVLGGSIVRHRTRRRLALELEVGNLLASTESFDAMSSGLARALRRVMNHDLVELWLPGSSSSGAWVRHVPESLHDQDDSSFPRQPPVREGAAPAGIVYEPAHIAGARHALIVPVLSGSSILAIVRVLGRELPPPDPELRSGLERVANMLGDFLERFQMLRTLQQSEARYREHSTELESLYAAMQAVEINLREVDRQKDDFLAMLGHELRNPMAAIRNATELLGHIDNQDPRVARLKSVFERQTQQMTKLVDGLLDVSRVARGKVELQLAPVDMCALAHQVVEDRRPEFRDRSIELEISDEGLWTHADRVRVVQILDNLLSNACKFTHPDGHVVVEVRRAGDGGSLTVRDDGMGIEAEVLPRLFEPFRQGRAALGQSQGLGLGLTLVKGLVDLHGFQLHVQSDGPGRGALFRVDFPLTIAPEAPPPESRPEPRGLELLLVEDNPDVAETLAELLTASGHDVETVGSGEQALASLRTHHRAVVLCDIGLPGMDGVSLARQVREDPTLADVQLVAMTGYSDAATRQRMEQAGFSRMLIKPVQLSALRHCLARLDRERRKGLNRR